MNIKIEPPKEFNSLKAVADYYAMSRSAIVMAIRKKRLKALKNKNRWLVLRIDMEEYRKGRFSRIFQTHNGKLVFDKSKGLLSLKEVRDMFQESLGMNYPSQRLYYLLRLGKLKAFRCGSTWVVRLPDALDLLEKERTASNCFLKNSKTSVS